MKSALVTGTVTGIGKALCQELGKQGYNLTLIDIDGAALLEQRKALQQAHGVDVLVFAADVCSNSAVERAVREHVARFGGLDVAVLNLGIIISWFGGLDVAVLNAGIGERGDYLDPSIAAEALEKTLDVDLRAVVSGARLIAQLMVDGGSGGRIITLASAAGIFPMTAGPYYAAAKAGVVHFVRSLTPRLAPHGIQLAAVCPQYVDTPLVQNMLKHQPEVAKAMMGPLFGQPLLQPSQVVGVVLKQLQKQLPQRGQRVPFREAYAGAGCIWLLLQNGKVVDPFAANPAHGALHKAGARVVTTSSLPTSSSSSSSSKERQQPVSALAAASAASMARFSSRQALRELAAHPLPKSYSKLQVAKLSVNFAEAVQRVQAPTPLPEQLPAGHVLVRRLFVGINASDVNYTSGRYHGSAAAAKAALPYDAGFESVGIVVAAAPDAAAALPVGSAVATMESGFSEYAVVQGRRALQVPCAAPEVVALLTSGLTASLALEEIGRLQLSKNDSYNTSQVTDNNNSSSSSSAGQGQPQKQKTVLVTAAAGGTGQFAVQLAKLAGCHVVATCGGAAKAQLLRQLGVDRVIDYKSESVKAVLKQEYPAGIDLIYESVGGDMFSLCVDALAPKGTLIIIGMMSAYADGWKPSANPGLPEKLLWKNAAVAGFFLLRYANLWGSHLARLCSLVQSGQLAVALDSQQFKGLGAVPAAVQRLQSGASSGKSEPAGGSSSSGGAAASGGMAQRPAGAAAAAGSSLGDALQLFAGAMPKSEIGALRFLEKHPDCDGRGVVVAIFDTGVDPSAAGLQITTDGKPKIIDVMDCTGSGDIDTSAVAAADEAGCISGASGRQLRVNSGWVNPSGQWHVGCRRLFELFPKPLQTRVKEQRKKAFEEAQRVAVAAAAAELAAFGKRQPPAAASSSAADAGAATDAGDAADASKPAAAPAAAAAGPSKSELEARLGYLQDSFKSYDDAGPVVDCVVWHDGATWRVALDTSDMYPDYSSSSSDAADKQQQQAEEGCPKRQGLLADFTPLADFKVERQYGKFSDQDGCAYAVKVYDEGNTLSIVVDAGAHGTHVAGIVAAHFPEDPAANGMAPGAQIISCKIGDSRLGSMETGTGLVRALAAVMDAGADVINMSYGEPTSRCNVGRAIDIAAEAVHKAGVIFVAAAGNAGPALGTVGAPGGTSSALLGIGAYVSPGLAAAGHSLRGALQQGQQYTWSSRGPTADGDIGVALSAPGGAIAPVPGWTLQKRQLMNGTSMASPCAAGGLALILSGLKAHGAAGPSGSSRSSSSSSSMDTSAAAAEAAAGSGKQWISPSRVRRAVEATCQPLGDASGDGVLTYGRGLLQVDAAFDYLLKSAQVDLPDVRYDVGVSGGPGSSAGLAAPRRGVYMRQPHEAAAAASYTVTVTPALHEAASVDEKLAVEEHLVLRSTAPWVSAPDLLLLHHNGRTFELRVDPTALPAGLHYAEVLAVNPDQEWRGPLFRVPVTVVKPQDLLQSPDIDAATAAVSAAAVEQPPAGFRDAVGGAAAGGGAAAAAGDVPPHTLRLGPLALQPGQELRHFVVAPAGATWAEMVIRAGSYDTPKVYMVRATQLLPDVRYSDSEYRTTLTLSPNSEYTTAFKVAGDATLELTLSQFWSSLGDSSMEVELSFHGLDAQPAAGVLGVGGPAAAAGAGLLLQGAAGPLKLLVSCPLRRQRVKPEAKLTHANVSLRPKEAVLEPLLDARDGLPGGRVAYGLVLSYGFTVAEGGKYKPCVPLTNRYLYDSPLEAQLTQIFDSHKRLLYTGDAMPDEVALAKGEHSARLLLRHDDRALLEKLKGTCLVETLKGTCLARRAGWVLSRKLDSPVSVPVYSSHTAALTAGSPAGECFLSAGDRAMLWLGPVPEDKLPKDAQGRVLEGTLSLGQLRRGSGAAPSVTPFAYLPAPPAVDKAAGKGDNGSKPPVKPPAERLSEAVRDAKLALLKELKSDQPEEAAAAEDLIAELLAEAPAHLPLLLEVMKRRDAAAKGDARTAQLPAITAAADAVVAAINTSELAAFMALRAPADTDEANSSSSSSSSSEASSSSSSYKQQKAEKDAEKAALLEALRVKLKGQLELEEAAPDDAAAAADVAATAAKLRQWVDTAADKEYLLLHARVEAAAGRPAAALTALDKLLAPSDEVPAAAAPEASQLKRKLLQQLGWQHWKAYDQAWARVKFPAKLPPL
ncbi:subtilase family-domain-containing protein [Scenedesmus sp. NREL 46B-D3]|nr:subtilase family-domain-containing protein [Scenedesmus sp. NREL 46B-D3]